MLVIAVVPRAVTLLANAPLFRHPLVGPLLRMLGSFRDYMKATERRTSRFRGLAGSSAALRR